MARFKHILFVCQNEREAGNPKGSCKARGSESLLEQLKEQVKTHGLKGKVRVTASGCLDLCSKGCVVGAFSETLGDTWYTGVKPDDAKDLFEAHVLRGERLARLVEPL